MARRGPNWFCRAGVATITSTPSGSGTDGWMSDSLLAETPAAASDWHIRGSQPISTLGRICCAIQAAAWPRLAAATCSAVDAFWAAPAGCGEAARPARSAWLVKASVTSAPSAIAARALSTRTPRRRREADRGPRPWCRCSQRRQVVTMTAAHDGFGCVLTPVKLCCCSPIFRTPTTPRAGKVAYLSCPIVC